MKRSARIFASCLAICMLLATASCGKDTEGQSSTDTANVTSTESTVDTSTDISSEASSDPSNEPASSEAPASSKKTSSKKTTSKKTSSTASKKPVSSTPAVTKTGLELFQLANSNFQKWKGIAYDCDIEETVKSGGVSMTIAMKMAAKMAEKDNRMHASFDMAMDAGGGNKLDYSIYTDGVGCAVKYDGQWEKISEEEMEIMLEQMGGASADDNTLEALLQSKINKNTIKKQSVQKSGTKYIVSLTLDPSSTDETFGGQLEDMGVTDVNVTNVTAKLTISSAYQIEKAEITYGIKAEADGSSADLSIKMVYTLRELKNGSELVVPDVLK